MKYLYAFAVPGGFLPFLLLFSFFAHAQIKTQQNLKAKAVQKMNHSNVQNLDQELNYSLNHSSTAVPNDSKVGISAFEEMKLQGKKEDISKRDAYSKHYSNADGNFTAVISAGPIHFQKNGRWVDIETNVEKVPNSNFPYANTANLMESHFGKTSAEGVISKSEMGQVKEFINVKMYWEKAGQNILTVPTTHSPAKAEGNKIFYTNLYNSIDAEFIVESGKRKLNYIIPTKSALGQIPSDANYLVFSEDIILPKGWTFNETHNKDIEIKNEKGELTFIYQKPDVFENYGKSDEAILITSENPSSYQLIKTDEGLRLLLKVKTQWLLEEQRVFPIAVDPTVTVNPNNNPNWTGWATANGGNEPNLLVGYDADLGKMIGFSKFNLNTIDATWTIHSVEVDLYYQGIIGDLNGRRVRIAKLNQDPTTATYYSEIFNAVGSSISNYATWSNSGANDQQYVHWKNFDFSLEGVNYVQNARALNDWVAIAVVPDDEGTAWETTNNASFKGRGGPFSNRPIMLINYADSNCNNPSSSNSPFFIQTVNFVGSLIPDTINTSEYSPNGYGNYTSDPIMAKQIPGGVINIHQLNRGSSSGNISVLMKAWVDWNKNGKYDPNEKVYDSGNILGPGTIFGFIVPTGTSPGNYTIRLRTHRGTRYYLPCGSLSNGETEDYKFEVIADCSAKITAVNISEGDGFRCGHGEVRVSAQGTGDTTTYKWYDSEFGGNLLKNSSENFYVTTDIASTSIYWVTALNGSCESVKRTPVVARIDPIPNLDLTTPDSEFCGDGSSGIEINSSGGAEEYTLLFEKFDSGLGAFQNQTIGYNNSDAEWKRRNSPYLTERPPYIVLAPAIASGYDGGGFACAITDVAQTANIQNRLTLINSLDASELLNLKLDFDLYYQPMTEDASNTSLVVEVSTNGTTWNPIATYTKTQGNPGHWKKIALDLTSYISSNLKLRFTINSMGSTNSWLGDIAAIDNLRIYGDKPLALNLNWTLESGTIDIFNADCTTPYDGATSNVCIKPNDTQLEENETWVIKASASLSNGCSAEKTITITNNTKFWNPNTATNWTTANWKPSSSAPTADHCVIVKKELVLPTGQSGLAKNLLVKSGAKLTIQNDASLTVTDFVHNEATVDDFLIKSGGSLVQVNDGAVNSGEITAERDFIFSSERKQYNFVISPLVDWPIKSMYTTPFVIKYVEGQNWFVNAGVGPYFPAKGYAIKEAAGGNSNISGIFKGVPANGLMAYPLQYGTATTQTGNQENGYNLVGNPYPSALDVKKLYTDNSTKIEATFLFWDNRDNPNTQQQGSDYNGSNYATFNAAAGENGSGTAAPRFQGQSGAKIPNQFVATGTAFLARANSSANGQPLNFKNAHRSASTTATEFFGKNDDGSKNTSRYWLTLTTPSGMEYMTAVVYHWEGNNAFSVDDSEAPGTSDEIYTLADNDQVIIQGREPFVDTDEVPLGVRLFDMGKYVISIYDKEGVFANGQNIYLRDKVEKVIYNLSQADYKFISEPGEFNTRFELIYKPYSLTDDASNSYSNKISIELKDKNIVATSTEHKITKIVLYDLNNRPMYQNSEVNALKISIPTKLYANQIGIVSLETETGEVMNKKLILK